jgi:hypothetical protein
LSYLSLTRPNHPVRTKEKALTRLLDPEPT